MRSRIALGALAALAIVAALAALTDREPAPGSPGPEAVESAAAELTTRQLAGSRIVCGFDGRTAPQSLLGAVSAGEIGGVIYFDDNVRSRAQLARMSAAIQAAPRPDPLKPPVVISVDQEGGQVKRLGGAPNASAEQMGRRGAGVLALAGRPHRRLAEGRRHQRRPGAGAGRRPAERLHRRPGPGVRDEARPRRHGRGRVRARACSRAGSPRPPSTSRASGRRRRTPTCGPPRSPSRPGSCAGSTRPRTGRSRPRAASS